MNVSSDDSDKASRRTNKTDRTVASDDSDELSCRTLRAAWLDDSVNDKSRGRVSDIQEELRGKQHITTSIASNESSSRDNRCSVSNLQQPEQPVTPVVQSGSIGTTVVNLYDIDECLATNKHVNVKQNSISMSNQWLSNTFSMITSGILGKSKAKTREEFMENVDTTDFNFFL